MRPKELTDKVVLITGGGAGMGRSLAHRVAQLGVKKLILLDINLEALTETKDSVLDVIAKRNR